MPDDLIPLDMPDLTPRPLFEFTCTVRRRDMYGDRYVSTTPSTVLAKNIGEATEKAREAFGATYDDFRKFWSHDVLIDSVKEIL